MKAECFLFGMLACTGVAANTAVFDPIPYDEVAAAKADLIDSSAVVDAAFVRDFAVNGDLNKGIWKKAAAISDFTLKRGELALPTEARVMYSPNALYVSAKMIQPMDKLTARFDQDDLAIYEDDNFSVFLFVPGTTEPYFIHIAINANGNIYDARDGRTGYRVRGMVLKTQRHKDHWTVEMKLPFAGMPIDRPFAGDFIGLRFCRSVNNPNYVCTMPNMKARAHNSRSDFAKLNFVPPEGGSAAMAKEARDYRNEVLKKRFYEKYEGLKSRVASYKGSISGLDRSIPVIKLAYEGVCQLDEAVNDFERRNAQSLSKKELVPFEERTKLFSISKGFDRFAADKAYLVWPLDIWEKGTPLAKPPLDYSVVTNIVFEQAGNEREAIGLCFTGLLCEQRLDLRLVAHGTRVRRNEVNLDAFEIYEEKFLRYDGQLISGPLVRTAGDFITLSPGVVTRVWIVFNSKDVKPGEYKTHIDIKPAWAENVQSAKIAVMCKVWNFALPETRDWPIKSFFWGPNQYQEDETETLRLMHSRHVTHGWTKSFKYWYGLGPNGRVLGKRPDGFNRELAETANDEFFREAKRLGMRFVLGWNSPVCWQWYKTLTDRFLGMGFEYEDFVFKSLIADEFRKAAIPQYAADREEVAKHIPSNVWFQAVYLSTPPPSGATMDDIEEAKLPEFYKMWTVISGLVRDPKRGPEVVRRLRAKGCSVWSYSCGLHMHSRNSLGYYRNSPRYAHMLGLDGAAMWQSGIRRGDDGYDVSDGSDDGVLWSGPNGRFVPSRNFEAFREGLEDVAYLDRLRKELKRYAATGRKYPEYERLDADFAEQTKNPDQKKIDGWRLAVGRAIESLIKQGK